MQDALDEQRPLLVAGMARNCGVVAFVTDGTVGLPIVAGGVAVAPGDILVGDADGVVVVPRLMAAAVAAKLVTVRAAEAALEAKVKAGLRLPDFADALLKSGRVEEID
jgi:4-hydroxy-4-methyl-2-oxoglutarate aldolase